MSQLELLRITMHVCRFTHRAEPTKRALGALIQKFGTKTREERLAACSALVGRQINSFSELHGGEIAAMLQEERLDDVLEESCQNSKNP